MAALVLTLAAARHADAATITFAFSWAGLSGYAARGTFGYDDAGAPPIIAESGAGPTDYLLFLTVTFFDPADTPLQSFNTVHSSLSESPFFEFNFDTLTQALIGPLNIGGGIAGAVGQMFFSGQLGGFLHLRRIAIPVDELVDVQAPPGVIAVTQVPEPAAVVLALLAAAAMTRQSSANHRKDERRRYRPTMAHRRRQASSSDRS
jgi:hypothetical protein